MAGIEQAEIKEIIDHHRIGSVETMSPVFFRNQPLGCTATIVYQMYREQKAPLDRGHGRPAVQRHHLGYAAVPLPDLYRDRPAGRGGTGGHRGTGHGKLC